MPRRPTGSSCSSMCSRPCSPMTSCSPTAGAASGSPSRPIRSAPRRLCDWVDRGGAGARPQAHGPAGQGRLLGHRDQGGAGRRAARLSGVHAQGRDRRLLSRLREEAARASDVIYPAFATHNANTIGQVKALASGKEFEFQRLHGMGEELYEELARLEQAHRRRANAGAHLCAGRQPQGAARLSRPPPARKRRQLQLRQPHRR